MFLLGFLHHFTLHPPHRRHRPPVSTTIRAATTSTPSTLMKRHAILECLAKLVKWGFAKESLVLLAARGINADGRGDGGVRVGVLGKGDGLGRVATALLDDPLVGQEGDGDGGGGNWVKTLRKWCADGGESRGLLIRYGGTSEISTPKNSPVSLLTVPSPLLKRSNIEILLAPIPPGDPTDLTLHANDAPGSPFIQFPVHKSIVYAGEGETGLQTLLGHNSTTPTTSNDNKNSRVLRLLSLPALVPENHDGGPVKIINLPTAEDAIQQLKASAANSIMFERGWLQSGLGSVQEWVLDGCKTPGSNGGGIRPVVKTLISSIVAESEHAIRRDEERLRCAAGEKRGKEKYSIGEALSTKTIAENFESLSTSLRNWSQNAHSELQNSLTEGFNSHAWGQLAWWKLIWTADDVTANSREVVSTWFLPQSKRAFLFLAGRLTGAGFKGSPQTAFRRPGYPEEELAQARLTDARSPSPCPSASENVGEYVSSGAYPTHLFTKADNAISSLIPDLQTSANRLLMRSLSFSVTSAAASSLLYLSDVPAYPSTGVAALGIVLSMRWLQTRWGRERQRFQQAVREQARIAIVESERWVWQKLKDGVVVDEEIAGKDAELEKVLEASVVVGRVTKLLEGL
ncbi:hypothetical protein C7212DRAFT_356607 [Tuber magnatum]|uniref:Mmc1 C-terminal domain-containing protein n=1 Tax=Tuber magnatum TaxID=42249 RepID=A0A317SXG2_9PEZI|nr:hypothetical protein C7212DRAFT_356607 [Tuber magnatum]